MFKDTAKEALRQEYVARQVAREAAAADARAEELAEDIAAAPVETSMTTDEGLAFLRSGGEREDAA